jgi:hypothetical protein
VICYGVGQEPRSLGELREGGSEMGLFSARGQREVAARLGKARLAAVAATNDARVVAILLLLAAVALGFEMAASFHVL